MEVPSGEDAIHWECKMPFRVLLFMHWLTSCPQTLCR